MAKTIVMLGNGFSIDFITKFNEFSDKKKPIDLTNLFSQGDKVKNPWNEKKGFLSFADCPSLWTLGAHPNISAQETNKIITDIVTCANMMKNKTDETEEVSQIYLRAYCEFISYIKSLFVYYNEQITDKEIENFIKSVDWGWKFFFEKMKSSKNEYIFITYNYDIWLERIFKALKIKYSCLDKYTKSNITMIKPHGSINYCSTEDMKVNSYSKHRYYINDDYPDIKINSDNMLSYRGILIPPAGESINSGNWASKLRDQVLKCTSDIKKNDNVIICGISYWYVDRFEIDKFLLSINPEANVFYINPNPPSDLNSVLMTVFKHYKVYKNSDCIGEIYD